MECRANEVGRKGIGIAGIGFEYAWHSGAEVFHHVQILEYAHQGFVARHGVTGKKIVLFLTGVDGPRRSNFQTVRKDFKFGHQFGAVVIVDNGVDHRLAQSNRVPELTVDPLSRRNFSDGSIFYALDPVEHLLAGFNQTTKAVILAIQQINTVSTRIFRHLHRITILVGQQVGRIIVSAILGEQLQVGGEFIAQSETSLLIVNFELLKVEVLPGGVDAGNGVACAAGKLLFNHAHWHRFTGTAYADETAFFGHAKFAQVIGLFGATGNDDLDNIFALANIVYHEIGRAHV